MFWAKVISLRLYIFTFVLGTSSRCTRYLSLASEGQGGVFGIELMHWINPVSLLIKDQASDLYALSSLGVIRRIGVYEGRVRSESGDAIMSARPALTRRVKTLDKHGLVWRHILHVLLGKLWFSLSCYKNQNKTEEPFAPAVQHAEPSSTNALREASADSRKRDNRSWMGVLTQNLCFSLGAIEYVSPVSSKVVSPHPSEAACLL